MIKILQGFIGYKSSGVTEYMRRNYLGFDKDQIQSDFIYLGEKPDFAASCEALGANFYKLGRKFNLYKYYKQLKYAVDISQCDIMHLHISHCDISVILLLKLCGCKHLILHAHSTNIDEPSYAKRLWVKFQHYTSCLLLPFFSVDRYLACSKEAGEFVFGKNIVRKDNFKVVHNAIDLWKYEFSQQRRCIIREKLGITDDTFVIGNIARFTFQKNHAFLIDVYKEFLESYPNSLLLLVGEGELLEEIKAKVKRLGIEEKVSFLGFRDDIPDILQGLDCFVLTSRFEGLCISCIEAQAAGLPCVVSDINTRELDVSNTVSFVPLSAAPKTWSELLAKQVGLRHQESLAKLQKAGYGIDEAIVNLVDIYKEI